MRWTMRWSRGTRRARAPLLCLEEAGARHEWLEVDPRSGAQHTPSYRALGALRPFRRATCRTVQPSSRARRRSGTSPTASRAPGSCPSPERRRAVALRWLLFGAAQIYPAALRHRYVAYVARSTHDPVEVPGVEAAALAEFDRDLEALGRALDPGPWILVDRFCRIDYYLFMLGLWRPARKAILGRYPRVRRLVRAMRRRPVVERLWAQHYPIEGGHPWSTWTGSSVS